ncbi:MAG TPA: hypothetical protein VFC93_02515 [Chloroflexota bacterium]|nr:hypothetical protein [Chloroflexota bacterium]
MPERARGDSFAPRGVDSLLQAASQWTPREAVVFLMSFDAMFKGATGRAPTKVERLILSSLLRRRATTEP